MKPEKPFDPDIFPECVLAYPQYKWHWSHGQVRAWVVPDLQHGPQHGVGLLPKKCQAVQIEISCIVRGHFSYKLRAEKSLLFQNRGGEC